MTCSDMWVSILLNDILDFLTHSNPIMMKLRETRTQGGLSINAIRYFRMKPKLYLNIRALNHTVKISLHYENLVSPALILCSSSLTCL